MEPKLVALKLVLDGVDAPVEHQTFDDRRIIQKAVYLFQAAGVKLGYRFGWYIRGPYSTSLTKDYFALKSAIAVGDKDYEGKTAPEWVKENLDKVKTLSSCPDEVANELDRGDWLELLASLHYLRTYGQDAESARMTLAREKPRLAPFATIANKKLSEAGLLSDNSHGHVG